MPNASRCSSVRWSTDFEIADRLVRELDPTSPAGAGRDSAVVLLADSLGSGVTESEVRELRKVATGGSTANLSTVSEWLASSAKGLSYIKGAQLPATDGTAVIAEALRQGYRSVRGARFGPRGQAAGKRLSSRPGRLFERSERRLPAAIGPTSCSAAAAPRRSSVRRLLDPKRPPSGPTAQLAQRFRSGASNRFDPSVRLSVPAPQTVSRVSDQPRYTSAANLQPRPPQTFSVAEVQSLLSIKGGRALSKLFSVTRTR